MSHSTALKALEARESLASARIEDDPILRRVEMALSSSGSEIADIVKAGSGAGADTGGQIMGMLAHLMVSGPRPAPVTVKTDGPSGAGIGAGVAVLAAGAGVAAALMSGSKAKPGVPAAATPKAPSAAPVPPAAPAKAEGPKAPAMTPPPGGTATVPTPPAKAPAPTGPVTISLSDDASKKIKSASWIGVGSKPGDAKPMSGGKVPTSIKAIPVKDGETAKPGYEMIDYAGQKYWVSAQDKNTLGSWNQAFWETGGFKPEYASTTPDMAAVTPPSPAPKPAAPPPPAASATGASPLAFNFKF